MGGMDDMNAPTPPMDAAPDMPPEDPMGGVPDDMGGGEPPMGGDELMGKEPDAMGGEAPEGYSELSNKGKAAVDAYTKSIADEENGGQQDDEMQPPMDDQMPQDGGMPAESKFNFKNIIDETFSMIYGDGNQSNFDRGTTDRPQQVVGDDAITDYDSPFLPR